MKKEHADQASEMGRVPRLMVGAVNPMWAIQEGLEPFLNEHPELMAPSAKKKKREVHVAFNTNFPTTKKYDEEDL